MILEQDNSRVVEITGDIVTKRFSIDEEDSGMVFYILSDSLYSDKITAVLREYACNAKDANREAGKPNLPVRVTLPTPLLPELHIRDFGYGLSQDQIDNVYIKLCKSTKRGTNDDVGMLGIGAKSGFAYGESFTIISYQDGIATNYTAFKDADWKLNLSRMDSSPTNEEDGLEIIVPVNSDDVEQFKDKAITLFQCWDLQPEVLNAPDWPELIKRAEPDFKGANWAIRRNSRALAIMGNVPYPIDANGMGELSSTENSLIQSGLELRFPIGALDFVPSREQLQFTSKTKSAIRNRIAEIADEVKAEVVKKIEETNSVWSSRKLYRSLFVNGVFSGSLRNLLTTLDIKWKGFAVNSINFNLPDDFYSTNKYSTSDINLLKYSATRRYKRFGGYSAPKVQSEPTGHIIFGEDNTIVLNDSREKQAGLKGRLKRYFEDHSLNSLYLITYGNEAAKSALIQAMGLEGAPMLNISDLPKTERTSNYEPDALKNKCKVFKFTPDIDSTDRKAHWEITEVDVNEEDEEMVYVEIDRYNVMWKGDSQRPNHCFKSISQHFQTIGESLPTIYGFKKAFLAANKLGSGWISLSDYIADVVKNVAASRNISQALVNSEEYEQHQISYLKQSKAWNALNANSPFKKLLKAYFFLKAANTKVEKESEITDAIRSLYSKYEIKPDPNVKAQYDLSALKNEVEQRYPMMGFVCKQSSWRSLESEDFSNFVSYINSIDELTEIKEIKPVAVAAAANVLGAIVMPQIKVLV